jgi:hypothetical protein
MQAAPDWLGQRHTWLIALDSVILIMELDALPIAQRIDESPLPYV